MLGGYKPNAMNYYTIQGRGKECGNIFTSCHYNYDKF